MRAISLKCPNCNANLEAGETAHKVVCTYCGTQARVQHRTRFLERKIELPPARPAERQMPVAKQRHGFRWVALVSSIFPLLGVGVAIFFTVQQVGGIDKVGEVFSEVKDSVTGDSWMYGGKGNALFHDINDDGSLEIISPIRYVQKNDSYYLAAFDGVKGDLLWESETIGNHDDAIQGLTILHGGSITQSDSRGNLSGYMPTTGERLWKVPIGEKVKEVCADDDASLAIKLNDKSWKRILLKDGYISLLEEAPEDCSRVAIYKKFGQVHLIHSSQNRRRRRPRTKLEGMEVRDLVTMPGEPGHQVALGNKSPGTRIPMLAYLRAPAPESDQSEEEPSKKKHRKRKKSKDPKPTMVWSSELPAIDPLATKEGPPEFVAVSAGYIASIYKLKTGATHVVCFTREGGQRLWDTELTKDHSPISAIDIANDMVYVSQWGSLSAFKIDNGSRAFKLGR
jgi:DNA-directed RNA polymerase subunit RPC12/RpoP